MLAVLVLPPGSRRIAARQQPPRAEVIGSDSLVDLHRFFSLPMPMLAAATDRLISVLHKLLGLSQRSR
jgi:hypothetical protein